MMANSFHITLSVALALLSLAGCNSNGEVPALSNYELSRTFVLNQAINAVRLGNSGGRGIFACDISPSLPSGLQVAVTDDFYSCHIVGTPEETSELDAYTVIARNDRGASSATLSFAISESLLPPMLGDIAMEQIYEVDILINKLFFQNTGGEEIIGCTVEPELPTGIEINANGESSTCILSGIPTVVIRTQRYVIRTSNAAGSDMANIDLGVN